MTSSSRSFGNRDQRVDPLAELDDAFFGILGPLATLEAEGLGDHADGQRAQILGNLGDNRRRACARAAAHARGDKHHVRVADEIGQLLRALLGGFFTRVRIAARAETARELFSDVQSRRCITPRQSLRVRIDRDELDATHARLNHPIDRVAATTPDAQDNNARSAFEGCISVHGQHRFPRILRHRVQSIGQEIAQPVCHRASDIRQRQPTPTRRRLEFLIETPVQ